MAAHHQSRNKPGDGPEPAKVSVCTVTYARHPLLGLLERCLTEQDYPPQSIEWIIIDDSPEKLKDSSFRHAKSIGIDVSYVHLESKLPLGAKRNMSHDYCSGEIIVYMDDDDYYPPSRISHAVNALANSGRLIAGCSELPMLILPECSTWMIHALGPNHATANTLAFKCAYLCEHRYDPEATEAEEAAFLDEFDAPMVQLESFQTVTCIGHSRNTVDKRRFITTTQGHGISRIYTPTERYAPSGYIDAYRIALLEIETTHKHAILTCQPQTSSPEKESGSNAAKKASLKIAVITPYYQEDISILKRCHASVKAQTVECTHFLIADGIGLDEIDTLDCRHIKLGGQGHADNGNTPRSVGALCAMNEGFNCIAYLDADNWFLPQHIESAIHLQQENDYEVIFTGREVAFPDGELLPQFDEEDLSRSHIDTSSIVVFESAFRSLSIWAQMPRELGPFCDRVAFSYLTSHFKCGWTSTCSVVFETWYWGHFTAAGKLAPANAKFLPARPHAEWLNVYERFRQRSHTPFVPNGLPESPAKTRINLISILGPLACGSYELQRELCRHIAFFGMPPNNFLYRWKVGIGGDCDTRFESEAALERLNRLKCCSDDAQDWREAPLINPAVALTRERSFTLLEAYFRLIQATMSPRASAFSKLNGIANVIERSSSASYAADLLFEILPMHRAILVVRDPLEQIKRLFDLQYDQHHSEVQVNQLIIELCKQYIEGLLAPLAAAPEQQLFIVRKEAFDSNPTKNLRQLVGWLGLDTPEWPENLRRRVDTGGTINQVYERELQELEDQIDQEITGMTAASQQQSPSLEEDLDYLLAWRHERKQERRGSVQKETGHPGIDSKNLAKIESLFEPLRSIFDPSDGLDDKEAQPITEDEEIENSMILKSTPLAAPLSFETLSQRVQLLYGLLRSRLLEPGTQHIWRLDVAKVIHADR